MSTDGPRLPLRLVGRPDTRRAAATYLDAGLDMAFQPIVHLGSGSVIAYEALARPRHQDMGNPQRFFAALEQAGLRLAGEMAAFQAAMAALEGFPRVKLFLNASPTTLVDPEFDVGALLALVEGRGLAASDIVVEVTESEAVDDLEALARRGERLRRLGIGLAVDDAGAGHASFRVITRLRPAYIKIDRDLVHEVDADGARHAFIEAMVRFSREIGSRLVAEGIESEAELACLAGLGVEAGQGWFLARPNVGEFPAPTREARRVIALAAQRPKLGGAQVTIGELARTTVPIDRTTTLAEAHARFVADPSAAVLVVTERGRVTAQLSRAATERVAAAASWDRLADRPAAEFADHHARTVAGELDVVEVGAILAARERDELLEDVVVADTLGRLVGVASVRDVLRVLSEVRRRTEHDLNPLSGLSGPGWLEVELQRRAGSGESVTALFVELRGFKRINEAGGFALGDDLLRLMGQSLRGVAAGVEGAEVFHVGADDFMLLVPAARAEESVSEIVRGFEHEVVPWVRTELRLRTAAGVLDDLGLAMAAVDLVGPAPAGHRHRDWVQDQLAALIPLAKQQRGHACVRRSGQLVRLATWTPEQPEARELHLGSPDPEVLLAALDLVEQQVGEWIADADIEAGSFPGPRDDLERIRERYLRPARLLAVRALTEGQRGVELTISATEPELHELLDRIALVARRAHLTHQVPVPPEVALLDRFVRLRSRRLRQEERLDRAAQTPPRDRTSSIAP